MHLGSRDDGDTLSHSDEDLDLAVQHMIELCKVVDTKLKENVSVAQERQKKQYNERHLAEVID